MIKKEASDLFGQEYENKFKGIIGSIYQTFGNKELYGSTEEKAAHLLYFIIKDPFSIKDISKKASEIFGQEFNEKTFRTQLSYFSDINYGEEIIFKKGFEINEKTIKKALVDFSLQK